MLVKGDRIRQVKVIGDFDFVGTTFEVMQITSDGMIAFSHCCLGSGLMSYEEFSKHFAKTKWSDWSEAEDEHGNFQFRTDGKRLVVKRNGVSASASCHDNDDFCLHCGLELCLARLRVKEIKAAI